MATEEIDLHQLKPEILEIYLPGDDCGKCCGKTCSEMAVQILNGQVKG